MDILAKADFPASALSNFTAHVFIFEDIVCGSMEGFMQALKFDDPSVQPLICALSGKEAKKQGQTRNDAWKSVQKLWWKGVAYDREGDEYQRLIDRAYDALFANKYFRAALLATGTEELTHSIGNPDPKQTVLTKKELCSRLMALRSRLTQQNS
jgi:hypothetical protein